MAKVHLISLKCAFVGRGNVFCAKLSESKESSVIKWMDYHGLRYMRVHTFQTYSDAFYIYLNSSLNFLHHGSKCG